MATEANMICEDCKVECVRFGRHRNGLRRFRCQLCKKTYTEAHEKPLGKMTVSQEKAMLALKLLVEGASIRSIERITELHRDTILSLLVVTGEKCEKIMAKFVRDIPVNDVECDEIWAYVGKKEGHKTKEEANEPGIGDQYCFIAIERSTKLVLNFVLGRRDQRTTDAFIEGLRDSVRPGRHFQITTDGFAPYTSAITTTLGHTVDYAKLIKVYGAPSEGEGRYSPAEVISTEVVPVVGNPDPKRICTSIVERQNLTVRMQMRRLTRLTNAFSKKFENLWAAYCLLFAYYNFCRVHRSLRVTPTMQAGIADHVWTIGDLIAD